jgi:hypothetical protein
MEIAEIAGLLTALGCPAEKATEMAGQLDKRARQLSAQKQTTYEAALWHLLEIVKQGRSGTTHD